jgi:uncharacterized protein YjiK
MRHQPASAGLGDPTRHLVSARSLARSSSPSKVLLIAFVAVLTMVTVACSSASPTTTTATTAPAVTTTAAASTTTTAAAASSTTAATTTSTTAMAAGDLSGTWSGTYDGDFQGTFDVTWQQSGTELSGTITLSSMEGTIPITGTVDGDSIEFGLVGEQSITYSGSISGDSMSGTYEVGDGAGSGTWSATKSS